MRLTMKGATAKNTRYADKPNEDLFFFDEASGFAMILDGELVGMDMKEVGLNPQPRLPRRQRLCRCRAGRTFEKKRCRTGGPT